MDGVSSRPSSSNHGPKQCDWRPLSGTTALVKPAVGVRLTGVAPPSAVRSRRFCTSSQALLMPGCPHGVLAATLSPAPVLCRCTPQAPSPYVRHPGTAHRLLRQCSPLLNKKRADTPPQLAVLPTKRARCARPTGASDRGKISALPARAHGWRIRRIPHTPVGGIRRGDGLLPQPSQR